MQHGATLHPPWKIGPQTSAGTKERNREGAMCGTFSRSVGYNLCSFKCLLQNPNLNVSPPAPGAESKSNILYPMCRCSSAPPPPRAEHNIPGVRILEVCAGASDLCLCLFPETRINKEHQTINPRGEAGSINISYVQLSQTVRTVDCINRPHRFRIREIKGPPPNMLLIFPLIIWRCELFLYLYPTDVFIVSLSVSNGWGGRVMSLGGCAAVICYRAYALPEYIPVRPRTVVCDCNEKHPAAGSIVSFN